MPENQAPARMMPRDELEAGTKNPGTCLHCAKSALLQVYFGIQSHSRHNCQDSRHLPRECLGRSSWSVQELPRQQAPRCASRCQESRHVLAACMMCRELVSKMHSSTHAWSSGTYWQHTKSTVAGPVYLTLFWLLLPGIVTGLLPGHLAWRGHVPAN